MSGLPRLCKGRERDPFFSSSPVGVGRAPGPPTYASSRQLLSGRRWGRGSGGGRNCQVKATGVLCNQVF